MNKSYIPGGDNQFWASLFAGLAVGILIGVFLTLMLKHHL